MVPINLQTSPNMSTKTYLLQVILHVVGEFGIKN